MDAFSWFRRSVSKLKKASLPTAATAAASVNARTSSKIKLQEEEEEKIYGITEQLIEFVKSFSLDTFRNFVLPGTLSLSLSSLSDLGVFMVECLVVLQMKKEMVVMVENLGMCVWIFLNGRKLMLC